MVSLASESDHGNGAPVREIGRLDDLVTWSVFANTRSTKSCKQRTGPWSALVEQVRNATVYPNKETQPLIKLAGFGDNANGKGSIRHDGNVALVYGIEADYDDEGVSPAEAAQRLKAAGIRGVIYTSASHKPEKPRWRVLVPLSAPVKGEGRGGYVSLLNGALGGILAPESWTLSQIYYIGRVAGVEYVTEVIDGDCLDVVDLLGELTALPHVAAVKAAVVPVKARTAMDIDDPVVPYLRARGLVTGEAADGRIHVRCPWSDEHTSETAVSSTTYMPKGVGGLLTGGFKCLHSHCLGRNVGDFVIAVGFVASQFESLPDGGASARIDRTDGGNTSVLADLTKGDLRFVLQRRAWLIWRDNRWVVDEHGVAAQSAAFRVAEQYHLQAAALRRQAQATALDGKELKRLRQAVESIAKWATHCRNKRAIDSMLALARSDARFALGVDMLDRDPWLFGVDNGVVDLHTGQLREAAREDYVTRRAPVPYNPSARAPRWEQFVIEVTAEPDARGGCKPRPALAKYLQLALGYAMTGSTGEQKMFMAIGEGSNGKNVLLDTLQDLMGDYCVTVPPEALMAQRGDADVERPSSVAATLAGARMAVSSESKDGQRLDVALVKRHTGGGYMNARFLRENSFRFEISHKLWLMTNHRPALDHLDPAMRGRLHLIPFDMAWNRPGHPEHDPTKPDGDKALMKKLKGEAEGILAWLVAGAVAYHKEGLDPPVEVVRMTRAFFADQDPMGRWLETLQTCEARDGTPATTLLEAFRTWRRLAGESAGPDNPKAFSMALQQRNIPRFATMGPKLYGLLLGDEGAFA